MKKIGKTHGAIGKAAALLLLFAAILPFCVSCGGDTEAQTGNDLLEYLTGVWERCEDETYIIIRYTEGMKNDSYVTVDMFSYPALSDWEEVFSGINLSNYTYADLTDADYYRDNFTSIFLPLDYKGRKFDSAAVFYEKDVTVTPDEKAAKARVGKKLQTFENIKITVDDGGGIDITADGDFSKVGSYSLVSHDSDWFLNETLKLWNEAALEEAGSRVERFEDLKDYYVRWGAKLFASNAGFGFITEYIADSYLHVRLASPDEIYAMEEDPKSFEFCITIGYISYCEDLTDYDILAVYGWAALEQKIVYLDRSKEEKYFDCFKDYFEELTGEKL